MPSSALLCSPGARTPPWLRTFAAPELPACSLIVAHQTSGATSGPLPTLPFGRSFALSLLFAYQGSSAHHSLRSDPRYSSAHHSFAGPNCLAGRFKPSATVHLLLLRCSHAFRTLLQAAGWQTTGVSLPVLQGLLLTLGPSATARAPAPLGSSQKEKKCMLNLSPSHYMFLIINPNLPHAREVTYKQSLMRTYLPSPQYRYPAFVPRLLNSPLIPDAGDFRLVNLRTLFAPTYLAPETVRH